METIVIYDLKRINPKTNQPGLPVKMPAKRAANCLKYNSQQWVTKTDLAAHSVIQGEVDPELVNLVKGMTAEQLKALLSQKPPVEEAPQMPEPKQLKDMSLEELKGYAESEGVELGKLRSRSSILKKLTEE